jgi:hypothetical protein
MMPAATLEMAYDLLLSHGACKKQHISMYGRSSCRPSLEYEKAVKTVGRMGNLLLICGMGDDGRALHFSGQAVFWNVINGHTIILKYVSNNPNRYNN